MQQKVLLNAVAEARKEHQENEEDAFVTHSVTVTTSESPRLIENNLRNLLFSLLKT